MPDHYYPLYENDTNPPYLSQLSQDMGNYVFPLNDNYLHQASLTKQPDTLLKRDSLDSVIEDSQPPGQDIAGVMSQDKLLILRSTMQLLRGLIDNRSQIKQDNVAGLDNKILQCGNYLLDLDVWPAFSNGMVEGKRANLGNAINRLESEKNNEMSRCWSDQSRLYQELLSTFSEYRAAVRRSQLLSGEYHRHLEETATQ